MNCFKCVFLIILIYWLGLYYIFLLNIKNKNFFEYFYSYDTLIDLKLANNKQIKSYSPNNRPNSQHYSYQEKKKLFHEFLNGSSNLHIVKILIENVSNINSRAPEITQDSASSLNYSHYKLFPAQTRKHFNFFEVV